jgi:hypothetical protein
VARQKGAIAAVPAAGICKQQTAHRGKIAADQRCGEAFARTVAMPSRHLAFMSGGVAEGFRASMASELCVLVAASAFRRAFCRSLIQK